MGDCAIISQTAVKSKKLIMHMASLCKCQSGQALVASPFKSMSICNLRMPKYVSSFH